MLKHVLAAALCLTASAAFAQTAAVAPHARPNDPITLTTLKQWSDKVATITKNNMATAFIIDHENFFEEVVYRDATGAVEQHDHWNDNVIVQEGDATLLYGGTLTGASAGANGETRGGTITGGQTLEMHPGDLITIPAGIPHQMVLKPGTHFRFVVVKNRV